MFRFNTSEEFNTYLDYHFKFLISNLPDALEGRYFSEIDYSSFRSGQKSIKEVIKYLEENPQNLDLKYCVNYYADNLSLDDHLELFIKTLKKLDDKDIKKITLEDKYVLYLLASSSQRFVKGYRDIKYDIFLELTNHLGTDFNVKLQKELKSLAKVIGFSGLKNLVNLYIFSGNIKDLIFDDVTKLNKVLKENFLEYKTLDDLLDEGMTFKQINNFYNEER